MSSIDPITASVVSNKLWAINTEGAIALRQISGSPVATEANDMNTSLLTPAGECILAGSYILSGAIGQGLILEELLRRYSDNPGIGPDDMFLCNHPYWGSLHQTCVTLVGPIFAHGEPVLWAGATLHLADVGGPASGQVALGARSIYEEAPLIPPIKIVDGGRLRRDLEEEYLVRSRTRDLNALDLRAKIGSINVVRRRVLELVERYSADVVRRVAENIIADTHSRLTARLSELPDGVWEHVTYLDFHDGNELKIYPIHLTMTKDGSSLVFDFAGSAPQAPAVINCTYSGVLSGVVIAVLTYLCFDIPWSPAGVMRAIRVEAPPGAIVNATWPAGVAKATTAAGAETTTAATACLAKMLAASDRYKEQVMATWGAGGTLIDLFGTDQRGMPFGTVILDSLARGRGAGATHDGLDTGGYVRSISCAVPNVETMEFLYPLLYLSRAQLPDSGGAGQYRGGVGSYTLVTPHDTAAIPHCTIHSTEFAQPGAVGICGGYPGGANPAAVMRESNVWDLLGRGVLPTELHDLEGRLEVVPGFAATSLKYGDVYWLPVTGGGGYGDPLDRDPASVARDLAHGLVSSTWAEKLYGVVLDPGTGLAEPDATEDRRATIRAERGTPARNVAPRHLDGNGPRRRFTEALDIVQRDGDWVVRCRCGQILGRLTEPYKALAVRNDAPLQQGGPWLDPFDISDGRYQLRAFSCPGCLSLLEVEVQLRSHAPMQDHLIVHEK